MRRSATFWKIFGNVFIITMIIYICLLYYVFIYENALIVPDKPVGLIVHTVAIHILLLLFLTSYIQVLFRDPGKVPLFWGFFMEELDTKNRRYCLICHIFKPERCHHCSACNRCVLNMDHHCPWLNNCIGFYNRKFFLLLLFYAIVIKTEFTIYYLPVWFDAFTRLKVAHFKLPIIRHYLTFTFYLINIGVLVTLLTFSRFHIKLVLTNTTTLEHMDRKRSSFSGQLPPDYDIGAYNNFTQVFGKSPLMWFMPFHIKAGRPNGDGVVWPQKPANAQTYEIDMSVRHAGANKANAKATTKHSPSKTVTPNDVDQGQNEKANNYLKFHQDNISPRRISQPPSQRGPPNEPIGENIGINTLKNPLLQQTDHTLHKDEKSGYLTTETHANHLTNTLVTNHHRGVSPTN